MKKIHQFSPDEIEELLIDKLGLAGQVHEVITNIGRDNGGAPILNNIQVITEEDLHNG